jgi:hypothetical protein
MAKMVNSALTPESMKRSLVLTNEGARHWLRRILPPPGPLPPLTPAPMSDTKLFLLAFSAAFMAFYGFLA